MEFFLKFYLYVWKKNVVEKLYIFFKSMILENSLYNEIYKNFTVVKQCHNHLNLLVLLQIRYSF